MADRRQFVTQFVFDASLNGGFKGTLTQAQREFVRLGEEIKRLNAVQKDISAYQKQQQAIENTARKLENLRTRQEALGREKGFLQKQIEEAEKAGQATAALERSKAALEGREAALAGSIDRTAAALDGQRKKAEELAGRLRGAGADLNGLDEAARKNVGEMESLKRAQKQVADSTKEAGEAASAAGEAGVSAVEAVSSAIAAAGVIAGIGKLADAFAECTRTAADFERAMSAVEAIAGASSDGIAALNAEAKRLGASTVFTAQQSAEAMNYMAMAGWSTEEMLAGMSGVMDAAAASGEDLASVSDIITDSLTAFGLTAADAAHFSDILAKASAKSNTNIGMMGSTFQRAAPVAAALGYSAEDTAVAIGLMANSGIKASKAGTALINIFNGMLEGATLTGAALGEYEFSAIRADGTMKSFRATIDELRESFSRMTGAEKVLNAKELAGLRGYSGLLAILNSTEEEYRSLQEEINNCEGAARRMAEIKLDNLSGDVALMQSAWEGLKITIGEQFNPELRRGAELLTGIIDGANRFAQNNPAVVKGLTVTTAGVGALTTGVVGLAAAIKVVKALEMGTVLGGAVPGILGAGAAVSALAGLFVALKTDWDNATASAVELGGTVRELNRTLEETSIRSIEDEAQANAAAAEAYLTKIEELGAVQNRTEEQELRYQAALAGLLEVAPELSEHISQTADEYGRVTYNVQSSTAAIRENIEAMKDQAVAAAFQDEKQKIIDQQAEVTVDIQLTKLDRTKLEEQYENAFDKRRSAEWKLKIATDKGDTAAIQRANDELYALSLQYGHVYDQADYFDQQIAAGNATLSDAEERLLEIGEAENSLREEMDGASGAAEAFAGSMDGAAESAESVASPLDQVSEKLRKLEEDYEKAYDAALKSVRGQYSLWDEADKTEASNLGSVEKAMQSQLEYWTGRTENMELLGEYVGEVSGLYTMLGELAGDTSKDSSNLLAALAGAAQNGDLDTLREFADLYVDIDERWKEHAELQTNLQTDMEKMKEQMLSDVEEAIAGMERSDEAAAASYANIRAFIEEAEDPGNLAAIRTAYAQAAQTAASALESAFNPSLTQGSPYGVGGLTQEFMIKTGVEHYTPKDYPVYLHAEGGILTAPHMGMVAEDGPEAIIPLSASRRDRGISLWTEAGERMGILSGGENTAGGTVSMPVQITIQVQGNASQDTVEALRDYADQLAGVITERVMDRIAEQRVDTARRAWS